MPGIQWVGQDAPDGCGIACVAMVAERSYAEVKRLVTENRLHISANNLNMRHGQVEEALKILRIRPRKRELFRSWSAMRGVAFVPTKRKADGTFHWVIWDSSGRHPGIWDPKCETRRPNTDHDKWPASGHYIPLR